MLLPYTHVHGLNLNNYIFFQFYTWGIVEWTLFNSWCTTEQFDIFTKYTSYIVIIKYCFFLGGGLLRAAPVAYGSSQARGQIGATAAGLCHSHSNTEPELHLWPMLKLAVMPDT